MFCKYCGNPINRKTMSCTVCGKPVGALTGGNSFKELLQAKTNSSAGRTVQTENSNPQITNIAADVRFLKEAAAEKKVNHAALISAFCALICIISLIYSFSFSAKIRRSIEDVSASIETLAKNTYREFDDIQTALASETEAESEAAEPSSGAEALEPAITKNPVSVNNVTPGRTNIAFVCRASGDGLHFSWLKYSAEDNEWLTIGPDDTLFNVISSSGESSLKVINAGSEHEGTYICLVEDRHGHVLYSSPVLFSLSPDINEDDPGAEADDDPSPSDESDVGSQD